MRPPAGAASAHRKIHLPTSSRSSTRRSMRGSPIPQSQGTTCRSGATPFGGLAGGIRQIHRRGNREMGQSHQIRRGLKRSSFAPVWLTSDLERHDETSPPQILGSGSEQLPRCRAASRVPRAETYPTRPVHIVVGLPSGLTPDIGARLIAQSLSERLGQKFRCR